MAHTVHTFRWEGNDWYDKGRCNNSVSHYEVQDSDRNVVAILPCYYCPNSRQGNTTVNDEKLQLIRAHAIAKYLDAMEQEIEKLAALAVS